MRRLVSSLLAVFLSGVMVVSGCSSPTSTSPATNVAPTAPAAKVAATSPAKTGQTAKPAATPAPNVTYPEKGKTVTLIVPFAAGGGTDVAARAIIVPMEQDLGVPFQVVNKPGATTQLGLTEIAGAKPDGYTMGMVALPTGLITYMDKSRGATYTRESFIPVAMIGADPIMFHVKADSPYKTLQDLIDAMKANPEGFKAGTTGIGSVTHMGGLALEREAGVKMAYVHFDSTPQCLAALMGGHIDILIAGITAAYSQYKAGETRPLGVMDTVKNEIVPEAPTFESQGYKVYAGATYGLVLPKGTPKAIVDRLSESARKGVADEKVRAAQLGMGQTPRYLDAAAYEKAWIEMEEWAKPLMELVK